MTSLQPITREVLSVDVEAIERAESEIDNFISKRSRGREEANRIEAAWAETTRIYNDKRWRKNAAGIYSPWSLETTFTGARSGGQGEGGA